LILISTIKECESVVIVKLVKPFSKSGHVILPKNLVGKMAKIEVVEDEYDKKQKRGDDDNRQQK